MDAEQKDVILAECEELMAKAKFDETKTRQFCDAVEQILQDLIDVNDTEREFRYRLKKHLDRVELRIELSGDKIDPMAEGEGAQARRLQDAVNHVSFSSETSVSVSYVAGWNRLSVKSPSKIPSNSLLKDSMVKAMLLGIVAGIVCRFIPQELSGMILNDIASPIMATVINLLMGIMGPVFFLFIIVAVSSLGSMEELSKTGRVIIKRFVLVTLWVAVLTIAVAFLFFPVWGEGVGIDLPAVEAALLDIIPKDFVSPFAEAQIPQIVLLGIAFGVALLMMGDSGKPLRDALALVKDWAMGVLVLMMKVMPAVPFISTMIIVANGDISVFLQGWKYIAAAYVCFVLTIVVELVFVSVRCKTGIAKLCGMLKRLALTAFITAIPQTTMQTSYEISDRDMGIDASFTNLWLSLSYNLLSPARTIALVLSVFFIADLTGMTIDVAMLIVLLIMVVELSLASTGTTASSTVILKTLKLSPDMVGLFSAFDIFTRNVGSAYDVVYSMLEQLDAARETDNLVEGACAQ